MARAQICNEYWKYFVWTCFLWVKNTSYCINYKVLRKPFANFILICTVDHSEIQNLNTKFFVGWVIRRIPRNRTCFFFIIRLRSLENKLRSGQKFPDSNCWNLSRLWIQFSFVFGLIYLSIALFRILEHFTQLQIDFFMTFSNCDGNYFLKKKHIPSFALSIYKNKHKTHSSYFLDDYLSMKDCFHVNLVWIMSKQRPKLNNVVIIIEQCWCK